MDINSQQQTQGINWSHPAFLIATWFGVGKIRFAPGTFGSLAAFPLFILSHYLLCFGSSEASFNYIYLAFIAILFLAGQWASNVYMKKTGKQDPGEVVIDEVAGQILVLFAAFSAFAPFIGVYDVLYGSASESSQTATVASLHELFSTPAFIAAYAVIGIPAYIVAFILFRIFDIWKPWPIRWCDNNIKGGFGVMFDDIFAAIYAIIVMFGLVMLIPMFLPPPVQPEISPTEIIQ